MTRVLVRPAKGLVVRDPATMEVLPAEGKKVDVNAPYWVRRIRDKDVLTGAEPTPAPAPKAKTKETD